MKKILFIALICCTLASSAQTVKKNNVQSETKRIFTEKLNAYVESFEQTWKDCVLQNGDYRMPFWYKISGKKPAAGYPMYISMHGGGGTTKKMNDGQWNNQKRLYGTVDGLYWVPRAPTNSWNLWHQGYMEDFLLQAVSYAVARLDVDPNRIYIMGYSAGGDGTYNLAPRLADRFAAAAMMAGHPGDANAHNLRNLPFATFMGGKDSAYTRNELAVKWGRTLDKLQNVDPWGFIHRTEIYDTLGHWMKNNDSVAIPWMASFTRNPYPDRVIWIQDDVLATRKYNLEVANPQPEQTLIITFEKSSNTIIIEHYDYDEFTIWLNDDIMNLDKPVKVMYNGKQVGGGKVKRRLENISASIDGRMDKAYAFPAKLKVKFK